MSDRIEFANRDRTFLAGIYPRDWGIGLLVDSAEFTLSVGPLTVWWCWR